jgi:hypothetical protein
MPGTLSSAETKCSSLVPGFAKQVSMPLFKRVWTKLSAPFNRVSFGRSSLAMNGYAYGKGPAFFLTGGSTKR